MKKGDKVTIHGVTEKFPGKILKITPFEAQVEFKEVDGSTQTAWLPLRLLTLRK